MRDELGSIVATEVLKLVDLPFEHKPIDNKWILKFKCMINGSIANTSNVCAKGYTEREVIAYVETTHHCEVCFVRLLLKTMAHFDFDLFQMDVNIALLNRELDEKTYMRVFKVKKKYGKVLYLKRSIVASII